MNNDRPKVSILIPAHNAERFVAEAIESALAQTWKNTEVIVIDDGSTDRTADVVRNFGNRVILESIHNQGACVARNRAFELSQGEYIQFLDADDRIETHKIEIQLPLLTSGAADMVLCQIGLFGDKKGKRKEKRPHPEPSGDPLIYFSRYGIQTAAPLTRRSLFNQSGGFTPGLKRGQEADLHLRMAALDPKITMINELLIWVRMHDGDRISNKPADANQVAETLINLCAHIKKHDAWTQERRHLVSRKLLDASRTCFSQGSFTLGERGILDAIDVSPTVISGDRLARRVVTALFGVIRAEHIIHAVRGRR